MVALCCLKNQELQILNVDSDVGSKVPIKNYLFIINILYMAERQSTIPASPRLSEKNHLAEPRRE